MDNLYVYLVKMPARIHEYVAPCEDGYTIYLDETLSGEELIKYYDHAVKHIENGDFDYGNERSASDREWTAHRRGA